MIAAVPPPPTANFSISLPSSVGARTSVGTSRLASRFVSPSHTSTGYSGGGSADTVPAATPADLAPPEVQQYKPVRQTMPSGMSTNEKIAIGVGAALVLGVVVFLVKR